MTSKRDVIFWDFLCHVVFIYIARLYKYRRLVFIRKYHTMKDLSLIFLIFRKFERIFSKLNYIVPSSYKDKSAEWSSGTM